MRNIGRFILAGILVLALVWVTFLVADALLDILPTPRDRWTTSDD